MITDKSGLPHVGLAIIRNNLDKLRDPESIHLMHRGDQQIMVIEGRRNERFESNSFSWGDDSPKTKALTEVLQLLLGISVPEHFEADCDYDL